MKLSCAFAPSLATPEHIALAEQLGYYRAWCFDSPALYADVWMTLTRAAEQTNSIGLGPAVLVPSLRHLMTTAAATATLAALAPGRISLVVGSGFTGRILLGEKAMRWSDVCSYASALKELLAGREVRWEGKPLRMLQDAACAMPPACEVPLLIAADGPKGFAVAQQIGDGVMTTGSPGQAVPETPWRAAVLFGTVLPDGDPQDNAAATDAAQIVSAMLYHATYTRGGDTIDNLPGGRRWREAIEMAPADGRHLVINEGHMVALNRHDRLISAELKSFSTPALLVGGQDQWRHRFETYLNNGVSEIVVQPVGNDIPGELSRFAAAAM